MNHEPYHIFYAFFGSQCLILPSAPAPAWLCDQALKTWGKHPILVPLLAQEDIPETTLHSLWPVL